MRILVTGAAGFVGQAIMRSAMQYADDEFLGASRSAMPAHTAFGRYIEVGDYTTAPRWASALGGVDCVVHAAARVHVMKDRSADPLLEFRRMNVDATLNVARTAVHFGVRRFIFLSSVKVNGESTPDDRPFRVTDPPRPVDPYGRSKAEAEDGLRELAESTGLEVIIIRPTLVYGPGVRGNFLAMMRILKYGLPLPFAAIHNRRTLTSLDNLVGLVNATVRNPAVTRGTFFAGDAVDISTPQLLAKTAHALGVAARLVPVPVSILQAIGKISGKSQAMQRLVGSLRVDIEPTKTQIGWAPSTSIEETLAATAEHFLARGQ